MTGSTGASTPASGSVTVPSATGQSASDSWTGTIPVGTNPTSDCSGLPSTQVDEHDIQIAVPSGTYSTLNAQFSFSITWTPQTPTEDTADEILTVIGPDGNEVGSSDGGSTTETVSAMNLGGGTYRVLACGFINALLQNYSGQLVVTTSALEPSLPSAPAQGLQFSASVPADLQRDESEPLITIDKAGNEYTCGPTGFSQAADYAQVSTDGGNQFHLLGTPPRGQQAAAGGGDCGWATAETKNSDGNYQYAYAGLGALSGFATATSPDNGHRIGTLGADLEGGATNQGGGADRQWLTFLDDHTVLMSYNQTAPHNTVVIKSTDSGLTYDVANAKVGAPSTRFPGPMRYDPVNKVVFFPWDRAATGGGDSINLSVSKDGGNTWTDCRAAVAPANTNGFVTADSDNAGNIYLVYGEQASFHTYLVTLTAANVSKCDNPVVAGGPNPTNNPGFSQPVQVDRDAVRSTVFPWVTAGGAPGRVAVTFAGSTSDGNPNSGLFKGAWDVYVNQSLNALSTDPLNPATFSQVKATTHPFHYDSICLNGLACDLAVPPGDRTMADFFSIDYNAVTKKLGVVFNRTNKLPDESLGHIATPMVVTQTAGPTNGGTTLGTSPAVPIVRTSSSDPTGDALSNYSLVTPVTPPPVGPPTANEPAADFTSVSVGPELDLLDNSTVTNGGFTVTMKVADLSATSLAKEAADTGSQSLLWVFHFTNGYQDAAASARWNAAGFTFGYNDYVLGSAPCETTGPVTNEKCVIFPGDQPIQGDVDQSTGTIRLSVPRYLLQALGPNDAFGRPTQVPATTGSRFFDATAFSVGNASPVQEVQSFLYPLDNTPAMDFLLGSGAGGGGTAFPGCKVSGNGTLATTGGKFSINAHATVPPTGGVAYTDSNTDFHSTTLASVSCSGSTATVKGSGRNNGDNVGFTLDVADNGKGPSDTFSLTLSSGGSRSGTLKQGNIQVHD